MILDVNTPLGVCSYDRIKILESPITADSSDMGLLLCSGECLSSGLVYCRISEHNNGSLWLLYAIRLDQLDSAARPRVRTVGVRGETRSSSYEFKNVHSNFSFGGTVENFVN